MSSALHKAIEDALGSTGYRDRGILVNKLLEATSPVHANEQLLYRAVYTIFRALPERLVPGTTLDIATGDLPDGGIEIFWEGKEKLDPSEAGKDIREVLGRGPHGDLVEIALVALENYCNVHAGYMDTHRELSRSSSFERPAHVIRRVLAVIPGEPRRDGEARRDRLGSTPDATERMLEHSQRSAAGPAERRPPTKRMILLRARWNYAVERMRASR